MAEVLFPVSSGGGGDSHRPEAGATGLLSPAQLAAAWAGTPFACTGQTIRNLVNKGCAGATMPALRVPSPTGGGRMAMLLDRGECEAWMRRHYLSRGHGGKRDGAGRPGDDEAQSAERRVQSVGGRPLGRKNRRRRSRRETEADRAVGDLLRAARQHGGAAAHEEGEDDGFVGPGVGPGGRNPLQQQLVEAQITEKEAAARLKQLEVDKALRRVLDVETCRLAWRDQLAPLRTRIEQVADVLQRLLVTEHDFTAEQAEACADVARAQVTAAFRDVAADALETAMRRADAA